MHVFLLILSISGQPERIAAICETYQQCSGEGAKFQAAYSTEHHIEPRDVAYRVQAGIVLPVGKGETL
jgi:hypothetical protein